jgi:hypothetical protein
MALEKEMETYRRELPNLLETDEGRFVLIQGDKVDSVWDTRADAVQAGDDRFGLEPFMVKQILEYEQPIFVPFDIAPKCPS